MFLTYTNISLEQFISNLPLLSCSCPLTTIVMPPLIENALKEGTLLHDEKEDSWIELLKADIESISTNESEFVESVLPTIDQSKVILSEYGL